MTFTPLDGVRVVDVTTSLAGPYCTQILAALGADVVKVEPLDGDEARRWGPPFVDSEGPLFASANSGKRSLALSLRAGREVVARLAGQADAFVQSLRPGLAEELGLDAATLRGRRPELVHCSIGAFGRAGPLRDAPGYDPLLQAFTGMISVTGDAGGPGVRSGVSVVDVGTGLWGAVAILAALRAGGGATVDLSLLETALGLMAPHLTGYLASGHVPGRHGTAYPTIVPYRVYETRDAPLMVAAANDGLYERLRAVLDLPADARFATNPQRVEAREELDALIEARLRREDRATWLERLRAAGVPAAPVQDVAEAAEHEQTQALGLIQQLGSLFTVATPLSVDGERVGYPSPPPRRGEHTREVLREAGYSDEEVAALARAGAVRV